jgi:hypothetical protein
MPLTWNQSGRTAALWLKLLIPLVLVLFVGAGICTILFRKPPALAKPELFEKRFAQEIQYLEELARHYESIKDNERWFLDFDVAEEKFDDPALVSVGLYLERTRHRSNLIVIKNGEAGDIEWGLPTGKLDIDQPAITVPWYPSKRQLVKYENLIEAEKGETMGYLLIINLDIIEEELAKEAVEEETAPGTRDNNGIDDDTGEGG